MLVRALRCSIRDSLHCPVVHRVMCSLAGGNDCVLNRPRGLQGPSSSKQLFATSSANGDDSKTTRKQWRPHLSMDDETRQYKEAKIKTMEQEEVPRTLFAKVKYYFKRYWYIAVPAHAVGCLLWFGGLYAIVYSGVDVIALLEMMHIPQALVEKIKNVPPSAGLFVVTAILYKIATPARYATTLALIQVIISTMRRLGKLRTVNEVELNVRKVYTNTRKALRTSEGVRKATVISKKNGKNSNQ